jgi:WbqC-like protein
MKIAILQPNYIPWKGVFDLISRVDVFVFLDDVQYTVRDWRNRNKIRTANGDIWLSVPVLSKGLHEQRICDALINRSSNWQRKHYKTLTTNYHKAKYFSEYEFLLEEIYLSNDWARISDLNIFSTKLIAHTIGIEVQWHKSSDLKQSGSKEGEKIVKICKLLGCNSFINGPSAKQFMNESLFRENGIELAYMEYRYPEYVQLHRPFVHEVSVLDVLFNCGPDARKSICMG